MAKCALRANMARNRSPDQRKEPEGRAEELDGPEAEGLHDCPVSRRCLPPRSPVPRKQADARKISMRRGSISPLGKGGKRPFRPDGGYGLRNGRLSSKREESFFFGLVTPSRGTTGGVPSHLGLSLAPAGTLTGLGTKRRIAPKPVARARRCERGRAATGHTGPAIPDHGQEERLAEKLAATAREGSII